MTAATDPAPGPHKSPKRDSIAKSLTHYTPSVLFRNVVGILNTFIRPKLLSPDGFGLFSLLNVIPAYSSYLQLGSRDYMRFAIPQLEADGDEEAIHEIEASVLWGGLTPALAVGAALAMLALFSSFEAVVRVGLVAMAAMVVLNSLYEYGVNLMKGHQLFLPLSRVIYARNALQLLLSITLMLFLGIYGLFLALPLTLIISLLYLRILYPFGKNGHFTWSVYAKMVRDGFPLAVFSFTMALMITSGRLLVASYLTTQEVGYYALATLALNGMLKFPGVAREVVEPRIMEEAHTMHIDGVLDRYLYRPLAINACYLPLIIIPLYFLLPPLIQWMLPLYKEGIAPLQIILFGFYFLSVFYPLRGIIVAQRLQAPAALLILLCLLVNVGLSLLALVSGFGIVGVAVANSISYAVLLVLMAGMLRLRRNIRFPLAKVWPVIAAFPAMCAAVWASGMWLEPLVGSGLIGAIMQCAVLTATGLAILTIADRSVPLLKGISPLSVCRSMIRKARKH